MCSTVDTRSHIYIKSVFDAEVTKEWLMCMTSTEKLYRKCYRESNKTELVQ